MPNANFIQISGLSRVAGLPYLLRIVAKDQFSKQQKAGNPSLSKIRNMTMRIVRILDTHVTPHHSIVFDIF